MNRRKGEGEKRGKVPEDKIAEDKKMRRLEGEKQGSGEGEKEGKPEGRGRKTEVEKMSRLEGERQISAKPLATLAAC